MDTGAVALLYNFGKTERAGKIRFILMQLGVESRDVPQEDYLLPIGVLAGVREKTEKYPVYQGQGFNQEMLVMKGFTERQIDGFLGSFQKQGIPRIDLKAILTPTNQRWNSLELYEELRKEHAAMHKA